MATAGEAGQAGVEKHFRNQQRVPLGVLNPLHDKNESMLIPGGGENGRYL